MSTLTPWPPAWAGPHVEGWQAGALALGWPEPGLTPDGDLDGELGWLERELHRTREERAKRGRELYSAVGRPLVVLAVTAEAVLYRDASGQVGAIGHPRCGTHWSAGSLAQELGIAAHVEPERPAGLPSSAALREANKRGTRALWKRERFAPTEQLGTVAARTSEEATSAPRAGAPALALVVPATEPDELVWIDVETTGRSANLHQVIELGVAVTDREGRELRAPAAALVGLKDWSARDLSAIAVHGIDWRTEAFARVAKPMEEVFERAFARVRGRWVAGHNVRFDCRFLAAGAERCGLEVPSELRDASEVLDTLALARTLRAMGRLRVDSCGLGALCAHFGIAHTAHRAAGDLAATIELYRRLRALEMTTALARKSA